MTPEFLHPELVRFAFVLGVVISIKFYDERHLTTGGIAVPAYLGFAVFFPLLAPLVIVIALITFAVVHVILPRFLILSAAAKFSLLVVVSSGIHLILDALFLGAVSMDDNEALLRGLGYVVPGLIAHDFSRHGIQMTLRNVLMTSVIVATAIAVLSYLAPEFGRFYPSKDYALYPVTLQAMPMLVFLSLIAWVGLTRFCHFRCGGFLGGAFMTLLILQPMELAVFAVTAAATILTVKYGVEPYTILFGRRKFAAHILVGAILSWMVFIVREAVFLSYTISTVTPSLAVVGVLLTGLLASDLERVGIYRTGIGVLGSVAFTLAGTLLVVEALTYGLGGYVLPLFVLVLVMLLAATILIRMQYNRQQLN